ncbi:MAG: transposase [Spirosomataceae bacterium]
MVDKFIYHQETDTYTCPQGKTLQTTGTWHTKSRERDSYKMKKYRTPDCKQCTVRHLCTFKADGRREIERSQYADAVELNKRNYLQNKDLYRKRQEINEHIFGTIKRQWGYNYTNLRGLSKVNGEMALIMTVYNIKRAHQILGFEELMKKLKNLGAEVSSRYANYKKTTYFKPICRTQKIRICPSRVKSAITTKLQMSSNRGGFKFILSKK